MIHKCFDRDKQEILEYIQKDYGKCLYVYIDLIKYSLDGNDTFFAWKQTDRNGKITLLITEYYKGIQLYSRDGDFDAAEIAQFLKEKDPTIILGMHQTIQKIHPFLPERKQEIGTVGQIRTLKIEKNEKAYEAPIEEFKEIAEFIAQDENIGKPYGFDSIYTQYTQRKKEHFGRNYLLRDENNEIIAHAATYAELDNLAVVGGVRTSEKYRGKGYSKPVLAALVDVLLKEGKDVFSFYYIPSAKKMHEGTGFTTIGSWAKLIK